MSVERRREMVEASHPHLSIVRQCALLEISRSGCYYRPVGESEPTLALMRLIDEARRGANGSEPMSRLD